MSTTSDRNDPGINKKKDNGQQESYLILSDEERQKGYVRPFRDSYIHDKCGVVTRMGFKIAETYAVNNKFYTHTFCTFCGTHLPVEEFHWDDNWDNSNDIVGS